MACLRLTALAFIVLGGWVQSTAQLSNLRVHVVDVTGAAIESMVFIHAAGDCDRSPLYAAPEDQKLGTDKSGLIIASLRPRTFYNVCTFAIAFAPSCVTVLVEKDKDLKIVMNVDGLMTSYFADSFHTQPPKKNKPHP